MPRKILLLTLVGVAVVALLPELIPTGPTSSLNASEFLASGQLALGAAVIFAGGLLTALTPCVYPLIPITVSIFGATRAESRGKAVLLTSSYVVGMGVVFAVLGVLAARTGALFGSVLSDPRFVVGLPIFLLGAFTIRLPKGGQWMEWVKSVLGIALVALAASYLKDAWPPLGEVFKTLAAQLGHLPGAAIATALAAIGLVAGAIHLSFKAGVTLVVAAILLRTTAVGAPTTGDAWVRLGWADPPQNATLTWTLHLNGSEPEA